MYIESTGTVPAQHTLRVTQDTVLAVRSLIHGAIGEAHERLSAEIGNFELRRCADDPVSLDATAAWNHRLVTAGDSHANVLNAYIVELRALVEKLDDAAVAYGLAEGDNADMFRGADG